MHAPLPYRLLTQLAVPILPAALRDPRQRMAHQERLGAPDQLASWARAHRDSRRPLAWFHASSVGEGLQARIVIEAYRRRRPDDQVIYTHYSPSALPLLGTIEADWKGYLPYDRTGDVARALDAVRPTLLVFAKLDLWPELTHAATRRGTRVAMVAATVLPDSRRLRWPSRAITRSAYAALRAVGAISTDDARRLITLGCEPARVLVTGDPRVDSALQVVDGIGTTDSLRRLTDPAMTMVAGSTWPDDEAVLLESFASLHRDFPAARLILVPHDPTGPRLAAIEADVVARGLPPAKRFSALEPGATDPVILVDRVGLLARLYGAGAMAYVGGGWGHRGIHSVLEPAAWARPVVIGPEDRGSPDAALLARAGALIRLSAHGDVAGSLTRQWRAWLEHPVACLGAGSAARLALETERGAAERSAELLVELVEQR